MLTLPATLRRTADLQAKSSADPKSLSSNLRIRTFTPDIQYIPADNDHCANKDERIERFVVKEPGNYRNKWQSKEIKRDH